MTITKEDLHAALARLAERFPQTFVLEKHLPHRPLKIGIDRDLVAHCPDLDHRERRAVLRYYTSRVMYLEACVAGAARIDLDGNPAGEVSAAEARLAGILASRHAKRAAALTARRPARIASPAAAAATSPPPLAAAPVAAPPAAKVSTLKERPVLRLPAFRRQHG